MRLLALATAFLATPLCAHEFWIEPDAYQIAPDGEIVADLINGQDFTGQKLAFLPQRFVHFALFHGDAISRVPGRVGDTPALNMPPEGEGLHVYAYQSTPSVVSYDDWEKFQKFVDHKDFGDVLSLHQARGLPLDAFSEVYTRYSKSLVGVGHSVGADRRMGLETEIVALTNPYTDDLSNGMKFALYYGADLRPNVRFEVFAKSPDGSVTQTFYTTDANGIATVPVQSGFSYMADAVVLREPNEARAADTGTVWETLWANMTWAVP